MQKFPTLKRYNYRRCDNARYYQIILKNIWNFKLNRCSNPLNKYYRGVWAKKCTQRKGYTILKYKCLA